MAQMTRETDTSACQYDNVADVLFRQNFADIYQQYLHIKAAALHHAHVIILHGMCRYPSYHFVSE